MVQFLNRRFCQQGWFQEDHKARNPTSLGVVIRISHDNKTNFVKEPQSMDDNLENICNDLDVAVIFTMSSLITGLLFDRIAAEDSEITLRPSKITVPIVNTLQDLTKGNSGVRRRDFCCFVRDSRLVLIWTNSVNEIMLESSNVESKLMSSVSHKIPPYGTGADFLRFGVKKSLTRLARLMSVGSKIPPQVLPRANSVGRKETVTSPSLMRSTLLQKKMKSLTLSPWSHHLARSYSLIHSWSVLLCVY
jgi:hypothetical protein